MKKERNSSVLLRDNLRGWVDSAAMNFVKGAHIYIFFV